MMRSRRGCSLLTRQIISVLIAGILLTVGLAYIESRMFVEILFQQQGGAYEEKGRHARENVDVLIREARGYLVQLSNRSSLLSGEKEQIVEDLKKSLESNPPCFRRAYYVSEGRMYSSQQVDLEVLMRTMNYDLPIRIVQNAPPGGGIQMTDVYRSNMITQNTIAIYRRAGEGAVMAEMDLDVIAETLSRAFGAETIPYALYTSSGKRICGSLLGEEAWDAADGGQRQWAEYIDANGARLRLYSEKNFKTSDWVLIIALDETETYESLWQLIQMTMIISAVLMLGVIAFLSVLAAHFVRPIRTLAKQMDQICLEGSNLSGFEPVRRRDEIGELSDNIDRMLRRINSMVVRQEAIQRQQYESELRALQNQLRPHFLYNTLNMLSALAISHEEDKIPHAVSALVHILLVSTDKVGPAIPLREELRCTKEFMHIINLRYGNQIDLSVQAPETLQDCLVPKLILQPMIENSVFHGCIPSERQGLIAVCAEEQGGALVLTIMDNGQGMSRERIETVLNPISAEGLRSTGLASAAARLKMYFGAAYGLDIDSEPGVGTRIAVRLPKMKTNEEWEEKTR